jgi:HSP20 family molecular chaperone IbpA
MQNSIEMKFGNPYTREILLQADIQHALAGGMVMPKVELLKSSSDWKLMVQVPGLDPERFDIQVQDDVLIVFYELQFSNITRDFIEPIRLVAAALPVPEDADIDRAEAYFSDGYLKLEVPRKK